MAGAFAEVDADGAALAEAEVDGAAETTGGGGGGGGGGVGSGGVHAGPDGPTAIGVGGVGGGSLPPHPMSGIATASAAIVEASESDARTGARRAGREPNRRWFPEIMGA